MRQPILPNPENATVDELRFIHKALSDGDMAHRLFAIILLLTGLSRQQVLAAYGCNEATLRNWIKAYNRAGVEGLVPKPRPGRPRKVLSAKRDVIVELFAKPKDLGEDFWTKRKFHGYIQRELHVELGYSTSQVPICVQNQEAFLTSSSLFAVPISI
jgi:transposase